MGKPLQNRNYIWNHIESLLINKIHSSKGEFFWICWNEHVLKLWSSFFGFLWRTDIKLNSSYESVFSALVKVGGLRCVEKVVACIFLFNDTCGWSNQWPHFRTVRNHDFHILFVNISRYWVSLCRFTITNDINIESAESTNYWITFPLVLLLPFLQEYKKANKVDKPTWGRFPWELESDLYKKWTSRFAIRKWLVAKITTTSQVIEILVAEMPFLSLEKKLYLCTGRLCFRLLGDTGCPVCVSDLQNVGSLWIVKAKVRYIKAPQNNHECSLKPKKTTGLLIAVHLVDSLKTHLKGCMFPFYFQNHGHQRWYQSTSLFA